MISLNQLSISFDKQKQLAFSDHTFQEGLVHGIIGLNGAGKTTFFNLLANALKPSTGTILLEGHSIQRKDVCYLETNNYFYSGITGKEYLALFPQTNARFSLEEVNKLMRLPLDKLTETYSTGMKKRLAIIAILKQDKQIYILDEPFNGLDLETSRVLQMSIDILKAKGKTIFISSHILESLTGICDEMHLLKNGTFTKKYHPEIYDQIRDDLFDGFEQEALAIAAKSI